MMGGRKEVERGGEEKMRLGQEKEVGSFVIRSMFPQICCIRIQDNVM